MYEKKKGGEREEREERSQGERGGGEGGRGEEGKRCEVIVERRKEGRSSSLSFFFVPCSVVPSFLKTKSLNTGKPSCCCW